jgi:hypothetical protein
VFPFINIRILLCHRWTARIARPRATIGTAEAVEVRRPSKSALVQTVVAFYAARDPPRSISKVERATGSKRTAPVPPRSATLR